MQSDLASSKNSVKPKKKKKVTVASDEDDMANGDIEEPVIKSKGRGQSKVNRGGRGRGRGRQVVSMDQRHVVEDQSLSPETTIEPDLSINEEAEERSENERNSRLASHDNATRSGSNNKNKSK